MTEKPLEQYRENIRRMETEELLQRIGSGTLTDEAHAFALTQIAERGLAAGAQPSVEELSMIPGGKAVSIGVALIGTVFGTLAAVDAVLVLAYILVRLGKPQPLSEDEQIILGYMAILFAVFAWLCNVVTKRARRRT